jgi:hypothetical protein
MAEGAISDEQLAELVQRTEEATSALMRGDMERYLALTRRARGFTLMHPLGGPPNRYEDRTESLRAAAGYFKGGEAKLELAEAYVWGDTVVLVMIERQHGQVGGLPDQDLAVARDPGRSPRRLRLAGCASPRRFARPGHRPRAGGSPRPRLIADATNPHPPATRRS